MKTWEQHRFIVQVGEEIFSDVAQNAADTFEGCVDVWSIRGFPEAEQKELKDFSSNINTYQPSTWLIIHMLQTIFYVLSVDVRT